MFFPKFPCEFEHVDAFIVFHAGERLRTKSFLGEEIEPGAAHPIVDHCVRTRVSSATSLYLARTLQISSSGFITPVEVSLWVNVTVSNLPVANCRSTSFGSICFPQSTWSGSAFFPQRLATSNHLSENAPHMQQSTPRSARFRIEASITPHAEEVERNTGCFVPNTL